MGFWFWLGGSLRLVGPPVANKIWIHRPFPVLFRLLILRKEKRYVEDAVKIMCCRRYIVCEASFFKLDRAWAILLRHHKIGHGIGLIIDPNDSCRVRVWLSTAGAPHSTYVPSLLCTLVMLAGVRSCCLSLSALSRLLRFLRAAAARQVT